MQILHCHNNVMCTDLTSFVSVYILL